MTIPQAHRGIIGAISFETLMNDPTLSLPVNTETTQKLLHIVASELHRLRGDIAELQGALTPQEVDPDAITKVVGTARAATRTYFTGLFPVPGIVVAVAYTADDALGTKFTIDVPKSGIIHAACFLDKSDLGLEVDLVICNRDFVGTADNVAFAITDVELESFISTITFVTFKDLGSARTSTAAALGLPYVAPEGLLYCQFITRGAPTIAANNLPRLSLSILADD
jgi:hypothetical protein